MSRRLMSLICLGMYCLCLWLAVQTVEKVRQISPGVSLRYTQALTGEQVKKAQTYIKSSQNTDGLMVTFWEETQVAVRSPVSTHGPARMFAVSVSAERPMMHTEQAMCGGNCTRQWRHQPVRCQYGAGMAAFWKYRHIGASAYAGPGYRGCPDLPGVRCLCIGNRADPLWC